MTRHQRLGVALIVVATPLAWCAWLWWPLALLALLLAFVGFGLAVS